MNYKQQIEQKAWEYLNPDDGDILDFTDQKVLKAFKAGAEAMREIANTWIPIDRNTPPPEAGDFLIKFEDGDVRRCHEDWTDEKWELCTTHWKPITL